MDNNDLLRCLCYTPDYLKGKSKYHIQIYKAPIYFIAS